MDDSKRKTAAQGASTTGSYLLRLFAVVFAVFFLICIPMVMVYIRMSVATGSNVMGPLRDIMDKVVLMMGFSFAAIVLLSLIGALVVVARRR